MKKWYALDTDGDFTCVGEFINYHAAYESLDYRPVLLVPEQTMRIWLKQIQDLLPES